MKKGVIETESIATIVLWIIFLALASGVVYFIFQRIAG